MERKSLTWYMDQPLYEALSSLSGVAHQSMDQLVTEAVSQYVRVRSKDEPELKDTLEHLRSYAKQDPDYEDAIAAFVDAEARYEDPLEGRPVLESRSAASLDETQNEIRGLLKDA
jgi:predicted transcriptional regulator